MSIESVYANRMRNSGGFNGYSKTDKPKKNKTKTKFKVGDAVEVKDEDGNICLKGKIISLVNEMHIEGTINSVS